MSISFDLVASIPPFFPSIAVPVSGGTQELVVVSLIVVGMGIADWIWGGDETETSVRADESGEDELFEEDGQSDDFGDLDGMDDWEDDEFSEMNDAGGDASELKPRIEELEDELDSVSSTMSTVRSENEEIAESVQDMEENIRKLLEIYEMVTRGVNPFVDDVQQSGGFDGDTFELFESDQDPSEEEELDNDIVSADAESFFDEDFAEEESMPEFDQGGKADNSETDGANFEDGDESSGSHEGGLTFEELKEEYESGSAEWADDDESDGRQSSSDLDLDESEVVDGGQSPTAASETDESTPGEREQNLPNEPDEPTKDTSPDEGPEPELSPAQDDERTRASESGNNSPSGGDGQSNSSKKPYLDQLPAGYSAELLVMEWLEYLQSQSDLAQTHDAIEYYENMEWISEPVARELATVLTGMPSVDGPAEGDSRTRADGSGGTELSIEHHTTSLKYISRLTGGQFRPGSFQIEPAREE